MQHPQPHPPSGSAVPHLHPHLPSARSQRPQPCLSFVPHPPCGADPWCRQARLIPCPLPPSTCLYITLEWSLHRPRPWLHCMCQFSLSCGCTLLESLHHGGSQSFTPSPPGSQRPCSERPGGLQMLPKGFWGLGGCCGAGMLEGRTWRGEPVAVSSSQPSGSPCLSITFGMVFASGTASWQQQTQPTPHQPLPWCQCPTKAGWEPSMGRRWPKPLPRSPPEQDPGKPLPLTHSPTHSLTHSLPQCPGVV